VVYRQQARWAADDTAEADAKAVARRQREFSEHLAGVDLDNFFADSGDAADQAHPPKRPRIDGGTGGTALVRFVATWPFHCPPTARTSTIRKYGTVSGATGPSLVHRAHTYVLPSFNC
jgi:hypothetical protein